MQSMLEKFGFDPSYASSLQAEGMGPFELGERLTIPSGVGSLQYTHGFTRDEKKSKAQLEREIKAALASRSSRG